jgi:hypothetical protein
MFCTRGFPSVSLLAGLLFMGCVNLDKPASVRLNCSGGSATCTDFASEPGPEPGPDAATFNPDTNASPDLPYGDEPVVIQRDDASPDNPDFVSDGQAVDLEVVVVKDGPTDADTRVDFDAGEDGVVPPVDLGSDLPPDVGFDVSRDVGLDVGPDVGLDVSPDVSPDIRIDVPANDTSTSTCTIVSGDPPAVGTTGHSPPANTMAAFCVATCDEIAGWGCSNFDGRQVTVNGTVEACGATLIKKNGYYVFQVSAGTNFSAAIFWWGVYNATCVPPAGGF